MVNTTSKNWLAGTSAIALSLGMSDTADAGFEDLCGTAIQQDTQISGVAELVRGCEITILDGARLIVDESFLSITSELRLRGYGSASLEIKNSDVTVEEELDIVFEYGDIVLSNNSNIGGRRTFDGGINIGSSGDIVVTNNRFDFTERGSVLNITSTDGEIRFNRNLIAPQRGIVDATISSQVGDVSIVDNELLAVSLFAQSQDGKIDVWRNTGLDCRGSTCPSPYDFRIATSTGNINVVMNFIETTRSVSILSDTGDLKVFKNDFGESSGGGRNTYWR